jgi:hypothetical protein
MMTSAAEPMVHEDFGTSGQQVDRYLLRCPCAHWTFRSDSGTIGKHTLTVGRAGLRSSQLRHKKWATGEISVTHLLTHSLLQYSWLRAIHCSG